jgi:glycosyltransferase involved in cell wall biosynthesis
MIRSIRGNYDLIHIHYDIGYFYSGMPKINHINFLNFIEFIDTAVVITLHNYFGIKNKPLYQKILHKIIEIPHVAIIVHSLKQKKDILKVNPKYSKKIYYLPHGFPINLNKLTDSERKKYKQLKRKYLNNKILLTLGFIAEWKNNLRLIKLFSKISQSNSNVKYLVIGSSKYGKKYFKKCKDIIKSLKLENKVILEDKFLDDSEYKIFLKLSDVYIASHERIRTSSGTLAYALAARKAIVSFPIAYLQPFKEKKAFLLAKNEKDFVNQINQIIQNKQLKRNLEKQAAILTEDWGWDKIAKKHTSIYLKTIKESRKTQNRRRGKFVFFSYPLSITNIITKKIRLIKKVDRCLNFQLSHLPLQRFAKNKFYSKLDNKFLMLQIKTINMLAGFRIS